MAIAGAHLLSLVGLSLTGSLTPSSVASALGGLPVLLPAVGVALVCARLGWRDHGGFLLRIPSRLMPQEVLGAPAFHVDGARSEGGAIANHWLLGGSAVETVSQGQFVVFPTIEGVAAARVLKVVTPDAWWSLPAGRAGSLRVAFHPNLRRRLTDFRGGTLHFVAVRALFPAG